MRLSSFRRLASAGLLGLVLAGAGSIPADAVPQPDPAPTQPAAPADSAPPVMIPGVGLGTLMNPADPSTPPAVSDNACVRPPYPASPVGGQAGDIDKLDGDARQGTGRWSTYGAGGYAPVRYDPGCTGLEQMIKDLVPITDGPNTLASWMLGGMTVGVSLVVQGSRVVLGEGSVLSSMDIMSSSLIEKIGLGLWLTIGSFAVLASGCYLLLRAHKGDVGADARASQNIALVIASVALVIGWGGSIGPLVDSGVRAVYTSVADLSDSGDVPPDVAIGDTLMDTLVYPTWGLVHFGSGGDAAFREFGPRLFAAGVFTRAEQKRIDADPALEEAMVAEKRDHYKTVAGELRAKYPGAYRQLAGVDTGSRPGLAVAGFVATLSIALVLLVALWWVLLFGLAVRIIVLAWPLIALGAQFPTMQFVGGRLLGLLKALAATAAGMLVAYLVLMRGVIPAVLGNDLPLAARAGTLIAILGGATWMWGKRKELLYKPTGAATDPIIRALEKLGHKVSDPVAAKVGAKTKDRWDERQKTFAVDGNHGVAGAVRKTQDARAKAKAAKTALMVTKAAVERRPDKVVREVKKAKIPAMVSKTTATSKKGQPVAGMGKQPNSGTSRSPQAKA